MLKPTGEERDALRSQIVTLRTGREQHRKYLRYAFTAQARSAASLKELGYGG